MAQDCEGHVLLSMDLASKLLIIFYRHFQGLKLQLHDAIYRLRSYSNSLTHILSLSNSHSDVASIQKNRGDKSHCVIVTLSKEEPHTKLAQRPNT